LMAVEERSIKELSGIRIYDQRQTCFCFIAVGGKRKKREQRLKFMEKIKDKKQDEK